MGFAIAQARLGPGRVHHCMRAIGMSERALELMVDRVRHRVAFGRPIAAQGVVREWIAESRMEIEQARLLVLKTAWLMDTVGNKHAQKEIAAIKVVAARLACRVTDRAIQAFGGAGVSGDFPLAALYAGARALRLADGPDEVHLRAVARHELADREAFGAPQSHCARTDAGAGLVYAPRPWHGSSGSCGTVTPSRTARARTDERRLTERGEEQARSAGLALVALGVQPALVYTSPKVRARDTALLACEALGVEPIEHEPLRSGFDAAEALLLAQSDEDGDGRVLVVGHEPDFSNVVYDLTGARIDMKKGGIAGVRLDGADGELIVLLRPRELEAMR